MRAPIFGIGLQAKSAVVSSQRRVNLYPELRPQEDGTEIVYYGTEGLDLNADFGDTPPRLVYSLGNLYYVVHLNTFWEVNNAGQKTSRGALNTSTGRVYAADNGTLIKIVDGVNGYVFDTTAPGTPLAVTADVISSGTVAWLNQYFIQEKIGTGRFYVSPIGSAVLSDALAFSNAESNPDNLIRVFVDHGELILLGDKTVEFWGDSGAQDFPFARLGSGAIEWGLAARDSVAKFGNSVMFLARNRMGESQVVQLNGYSPQPVGTHDFLSEIATYPAVSDATCLSRMRAGHPFYQINFPSANKSWLYDGASGSWNEVRSDTGRHRANIGDLFLNTVIAADYATGKIYRLNPNTFTDNGAPIVREIVSRHLRSDQYRAISRFHLDMEIGVGLTSGQGSDPQIMLQYSKDGGRTWSNEIWRSFGAIGRYLSRVYWNRLGSTQNGWVFKLRISDPVKVVLMNEGWLDAEGA